MGENGMLGGGMSPADVRAVMGNNGDWGGNGAWWIVVLFALMFGGDGFGWGNRGYQPQYATQDFVQNGFNFNDLQDQNRDLMNAVTSGTAQSVAAANQAKYDSIYALKDAQAAVSAQLTDIRQMEQAIVSNQQDCCCQTLRAIDGVNYNQAMNTAAINANTTEQTQRILDAITGNRMADMQNQINQLQLSQAMQGVVRYPDGFVYNAGTNPFCSCGCGNGYNI